MVFLNDNLSHSIKVFIFVCIFQLATQHCFLPTLAQIHSTQASLLFFQLEWQLLTCARILRTLYLATPPISATAKECIWLRPFAPLVSANCCYSFQRRELQAVYLHVFDILTYLQKLKHFKKEGCRCLYKFASVQYHVNFWKVSLMRRTLKSLT